MTTVGFGARGGRGRLSVLLPRPLSARIIAASLAVCMLLPALVQVTLMALLGAGPLPYTGYPYLMQVILAAFVVVQAPALSRATMSAAARLGTLGLALGLLTAAPLTIMFVAQVLDGSPDPDGFARGLAGVGLYSFVIAAVGLASSAVSPHRRTMTVVATFLMTMTSSQVLYGVLQSLGHGDDAAWGLLISPFNLVDAVLRWSTGAPPTEGIVYPPGAGAAALAGIAGWLAAAVGPRNSLIAEKGRGYGAGRVRWARTTSARRPATD